jgi:tetratricopeptide (TPR) repeat protein
MNHVARILLAFALFSGAAAQSPVVTDASVDTTTLSPEDFAVYYNEGNAAYREGRFSDALELYQAAVEAGARNSALYYNLGNAHYRLGELGLAILNYERALKLDPSDEDARANLELARQLTADEADADVERKLIAGLRNALDSIDTGLLAVGLSAGVFGLCLVGVV